MLFCEGKVRRKRGQFLCSGDVVAWVTPTDYNRCPSLYDDACNARPRRHIPPIPCTSVSMPRLSKVQFQGSTGNVEPQQAEEVTPEERQQGCKEELAAADKRQRRVAQICHLDVLEACDEEQCAKG